jgi:hypothetical protein
MHVDYYNIRLPGSAKEDSTQKTAIAQLNATDVDSEDNSLLLFSLSSISVR